MAVKRGTAMPIYTMLRACKLQQWLPQRASDFFLLLSHSAQLLILSLLSYVNLCIYYCNILYFRQDVTNRLDQDFSILNLLKLVIFGTVSAVQVTL